MRKLAFLWLISLLVLSACDTSAPSAPTATPLLPTAAPPTATSIPPTATPDALAAKLTAIALKPTQTAAPTSTCKGCEMSAEARTYLNEAYDYIRTNSVMRDKVDWAAIEAVIFGPGQKAQTPADTYAAITYVLAQLGDNHSNFVRPDRASSDERNLTGERLIGLHVLYMDRVAKEVEPGSPAEKAGLRAGDVIERIDGSPAQDLGASEFYVRLTERAIVDLDVTRQGESQPVSMTLKNPSGVFSKSPQGRRLEGDIGYIYLPGSSAVDPVYSMITHQIIRDIDREPACGWVVDLQRNGGGYVWPMLAAVGPILGEGDVGWWVAPGQTVGPWYYRNGGVGLGSGPDGLTTEAAYRLSEPLPPVALLTSSATASAAELLVVAFQGRPDERSFGGPTSGMPSVLQEKVLSDGALVNLTVAYDADRNMKVYKESIPPDEPVSSDLTLAGTDRDPVLQAAVKWLQDQPACRK